MAHLPAIINDLAIILLVAGITTLLFKKINQPLVLGYIVAGIITGPSLHVLTISDAANVQAWSEIGVIFLMFALGLEFSFHKLKSVGSTAFIGCGVVVCGMIVVGYMAGRLLGFGHMDCLFLGCMMSVSSTTIVIKAFGDLNLRSEKFTEMVIGILIVEDIVSILMMVILSTVATASSSLSLEALGLSIGRLVFFLVLWFVLGMYLVPTFFKKTDNLMTGETLIVVALGLCLGMVVLVTHLGFSSALGAFIMGSLIAEAPSAEKIEHLLNPVKDLFGAVFFVSVGMMVDPALLLAYAVPVLALVIVTIICQPLLSMLGVLASGHDLETSVRCGTSLCQLGEFSFIIASLGLALGATSDFLYPIIVAVSVITTFTTPFCMNAAGKVYALLLKVLPEGVLVRIRRYSDSGTASGGDDEHWKQLLGNYGTRMLIHMTLLAAVGIAASYLEPYLEVEMQLPYAGFVTGALTLVFMAPILRIMLTSRAADAQLYSLLWFKRRANHLPLIILVMGKLFVAASSLYFIANKFFDIHGLFALVAVLAAGYFISSSDWLMGQYLRMESRFLVNMNEKHMLEHREHCDSCHECRFFDEELLLVAYEVADASPLVGKSLKTLGFRERFGGNILQLTDAMGKAVDMPGGDVKVEVGSRLLVIGTLGQMGILDGAIAQKGLGLILVQKAVTLREFMLAEGGDADKDSFRSLAITIDKNSPILGASLKSANVRDKWHCLVIGLERGAYTITNVHVSMTFEENDLLWVLGKQKMLNALLREEIV